ncbi:MAG: HEAT repeat domain-containing protein [Candidatus Margulisiibacteriota bacterium]|jgi:HEAT repeat protein
MQYKIISEKKEQISSKEDRELSVIRARMADRDDRIRENAAKALRNMGMAALPDLLILCSDYSGSVRSSAISAIKHIGTAAIKGAVRELRMMCNDMEWTIRWKAVETIAKLGPESIADLCALTEHNCLKVRTKAIDELGYMEPNAKDAVPYLIEQIDRSDHHRDSCIAAVWAVGNMESDAKDALPRLYDLCNQKDEDIELHLAAADAIMKIDPNAKPPYSDIVARHVTYEGQKAIPILRELLEHENASVRLAAKDALAKMDPTFR